MQNKKPWLYLLGAALLLLVVKYSDSIFQAVQLLFSILVPVLIGGAIAYVLNILVTKIERLPFLRNETSYVYPWRRGISIVGSLVIVVLVIFLLIKIIIPQLAEAFGVVIIGIPSVLAGLADWISSMEVSVPQIEEWISSFDVNWPQFIQKAVSYLSSGVSNVFTTLFSVLSSVGGFVVQLVISVIFALYILAGKERLARQFQSLADVYLKEKTRRCLMEILSTAHHCFTRFFVGQFTEAVIIGVLCTIGMLIFRFPYATMIGTLIGATALLPMVGAYIGAFLGAFMIFTINPLQAAAFLVFIVILQQLEGNLIYPRIVGSSIGLPGLWVLAAVTIGGGIGGIIGMLLAVPTAATIYQLLQKDVRKRKTAAITPSRTDR